MPKITSQIVFKGKDEGVVVSVRNITKELKELSNTYKKLSKIEQTKQAFSKQFTEALRRQGKTLKDVGLNTSQLERAAKDYAATLHRSTEEIKINANATKVLAEMQKKHEKEEQNIRNAQNARRRILKGLNDRLKEHGTLLRRVVPDTELMRKAINGNAGAMRKLRSETKKYISEQKVLNKNSLFSIRNLRNLSGSFSVLRSKILLATFAIGLMSKTVGRFIKASSDAEETMNKFGVVFGHVREEALAFAETLGSALGRTTTSLADMMATVQDTFVPLGFSREASLDLSKALTQLTLDVASFQNKADADVMRAFQSAIVGNHEAVRSFGIIITEAGLKSEALRKGIIKSNREMTAQEKVLARLSLIFEGTKDAQGDLARTQESYANTVKTLEANLSRLAEVIGEELTPAAKALIEPISFLAEKMGDQKRIQTYLALLGTVAVVLSGLAVAFSATVGAIALMTGKIILGIGAFVGLAEVITAFRKRGEEIKEVTDITIDYDKALQNLKESIQAVNLEVKNKTLVQNAEQMKQLQQLLDVETAMIEVRRLAALMVSADLKANKSTNHEQLVAAVDQLQAQKNLVAVITKVIQKLKEEREELVEKTDNYRTLRGLYDSTAEGQRALLEAQIKLAEQNEEGILIDKEQIAVLEKLRREYDLLSGKVIDISGALSKALETAFDPDLSAGEAFKGFIIQVLQLLQQTIIATGALSKALTFAWVPGYGIGASIAALVTLEAAKAKVRSIKFAEFGMNEIVTQPTLIMAGEAGAERVNITPLGGSSQERDARGASVNINISGGLIQDDYVRNELIPALNKAVSLGAELNA